MAICKRTPQILKNNVRLGFSYGSLVPATTPDYINYTNIKRNLPAIYRKLNLTNESKLPVAICIDPFKDIRRQINADTRSHHKWIIANPLHTIC